jgi:N-acetyl-anhydromuramyl-L-alanine amidase AmpD
MLRQNGATRTLQNKQMKIINTIKQLPSKGSNGTMDKNKMDTVVIHHDAMIIPTAYNTLTRLKQESQLHINKGWKHISYHFSIDNVGDIFQCLPETEVAYHCGNLAINKKSIAIKLDGNFEVQKPTAKQIASLKNLLVYLTTKRPDLPKIIRTSVKGHRDIKATACPGRNLYPLIRKF